MDRCETIADLLRGLRAAERGLNFEGPGGQHRVTYDELREVTGDLAARWSGLGVRPGDRVILVVADEREFVLAFLSALRCGVVPVPVFPPFLLGQLEVYLAGLRRVRGVSGARLCLTSELLLPLLEPAELGCPVRGFAELPGAARGPVGLPRPDDPAFLQFTSGSTGDPKGVVVTHRSLLANAAAIGRDGMAVDGARDRGVSWLPLYHDMGLIGFLFVPLLTGADVCYQPPLRFARNPVGWLRKISEVGGTIAYAPNFAYGLLARRATDEDVAALDLGGWRIAGCGAEPIRAGTLRAFADRFAAAGFRPQSFMPSYGLAEATLAVSLAPRGGGMTSLVVDAERLQADGVAVSPAGPGAAQVELVSCGRPLPGVDVRVAAPSGASCPDGREGEVLVRGDSLAAGYFADPAATARTWRDGWLHTGDSGVLVGGELYVTGRTKDVIILHGRNYHPQDIEDVAAAVPGVRAGNVVAVATPGDGETVTVVLEARDGAGEGLPHAVRRAVQDALAIRVAEVVVLPREALPKTSSGKVRRSHTARLLARDELVPLAR